MTTAAALNLRSGEFYKTMLDEVVEILSLDLTDASAFPIYGITADDRRVRIGFDGSTQCGDRLSEKVEKAAPAADPYLEACIDDELALAPLLNWQNFCRPLTITPYCSIYGTHIARNGHKLHSSVAMPQWRRNRSAADELATRCHITIEESPAGIAVHAKTGEVIRAIYSQHPSEAHARCYAICKAAIAYLESK